MSTIITFTREHTATISDGNSLSFFNSINANDSSDNSIPPEYILLSSYNNIIYIVDLSWTVTTSNDTYTAIINSTIINFTKSTIINNINATYTYTSSSITLSGLTINGVSSSDITLGISGNTYTFTQSNSTSTITYDSSTNSLTYSGSINQYALLMFGYVAILSGLYEDTISELVGPAGMCQTVAYEMLGF